MSLKTALNHFNKTNNLHITLEDLAEICPMSTAPAREGNYLVAGADVEDWQMATWGNGAWTNQVTADTKYWVGLKHEVKPAAASVQQRKKTQVPRKQSALPQSPDAGKRKTGHTAPQKEAAATPISFQQPPSLEERASQTLHAMRERALQEIAEVSREIAHKPDAHGDDVDVSSAQMEFESRLMARDLLLKRLAEIDAAIKRLHDGEYGICQATGEEIPFERLRADPLALYTVEYQSRLENLRKRGITV